jgi:hypothetical protein
MICNITEQVARNGKISNWYVERTALSSSQDTNYSDRGMRGISQSVRENAKVVPCNMWLHIFPHPVLWQLVITTLSLILGSYRKCKAVALLRRVCSTLIRPIILREWKECLRDRRSQYFLVLGPRGTDRVFLHCIFICLLYKLNLPDQAQVTATENQSCRFCVKIFSRSALAGRAQKLFY